MAFAFQPVTLISLCYTVAGAVQYISTHVMAVLGYCTAWLRASAMSVAKVLVQLAVVLFGCTAACCTAMAETLLSTLHTHEGEQMLLNCSIAHGIHCLLS